MKISMFQIAVVTAIVRSATVIKVDYTFPSPTNMFLSPIKMSHNQSDTSQHAINASGMDITPLHSEEAQQIDQDYLYEKEFIQAEAVKVKEIFTSKLSQQLHKAKEWTHITPETEEIVKRETYQVLFDSADRNFDRRMEFKEMAVLFACFRVNDMPMRELNQLYNTMDTDSNGFVDIYEWQIAGPQVMPVKITPKNG